MLVVVIDINIVLKLSRSIGKILTTQVMLQCSLKARECFTTSTPTIQDMLYQALVLFFC